MPKPTKRNFDTQLNAILRRCETGVAMCQDDDSKIEGMLDRAAALNSIFRRIAALAETGLGVGRQTAWMRKPDRR